MSALNTGFRNIRNRLITTTSVLALGSSVLLAAPAFATAVTQTNWTGNGSDTTDWSDAGNWDAGVPTSSLPAYFGTGTTVNVAVDAGQQPGLITVDQFTTVNLLPGSILNDDMIVGDNGVGTFNNTSSTHNVTGNLILGNQSTGNGTYTVTGDTAVTSIGFAGADSSTPAPQTPNGALIVGNNGIGSFIQGTDATDANNQVNVAGDVAIGAQPGSTGTYTINSGTLTVGGALLVGENSTGNNVFTQNGGSVVVTGSASSDTRYSSVVPNAVTDGTLFPGNVYISSGDTGDTGVATYNLNGGSLSAQVLQVGFAGTGTMNQSGGSVSVSYVDLGDCGGCNGGNSAGFYNLTGTGSLTTGALNVGDFGHGEFVQNGAGTSNTVNGYLSIGNGAVPQPNDANPGNYDRSGTYTLDAGSLSTQNTVVGTDGYGTFIQNGGTHAVSQTLTIGQNYDTPSGPLGSGTPDNIVFGGPSVGLYTMTGGTLTVGGTSNAGIVVGQQGTGTFNQSGGSVTSGTAGIEQGDLLIGAQAGSTGSYNLTSDATLTVNGNVVIGRDTGTPAIPAIPADPSIPGDTGTPAVPAFAAANGTLTIGNGTDTPLFQTFATGATGGDVTVGDSGTGTLTVKSGTANIEGVLGVGINGTGTVNQSGGSVSASYLDLSTPAGSGSSTYNLTGGNLTTTNDLNVGGGSTGTVAFNQSGTNTVTNVGGTFRVGNASGNASADLSGGQLDVATDSYVGIGDFSGSMTQSGGTHNVNNTLYVGDGTSTGIYKLTGGTLHTGLTDNGSNLGDVIVGYGGTGEIDNSGGQQISSGYSGFTVGWSGNGTYKLTGTGSLNVAQSEFLGSFGSSTFIQGDGNGTTTHTVGGNIYMSGGAGGPLSTYTLTDGSLAVGGTEYVGFGATSIFTQSGGTNTVGGDLNFGTVTTSATQFGDGTYNLSGGILSVTGNTIIGDATGSVGKFNQSGGSFTTQTLTVGNNGTGTFTQTAGTANVLGAMTVGSQGIATVTSLVADTITNNNKFVLTNGTVTAATTTNNGLLEGTGTIIGNVINNGTFHPGASPGILNVTGDYTQSSTGNMEFTLAGTTPGTGYSQLNVTGLVTLAGLLNITDTSFLLSIGEDFKLITGNAFAGALSGLSFNNNACSLSAGLFICSQNGQALDFKEVISGGAFDLQVVASAAVSAVPLPAALPMFLSTIAGFFGFSLTRKRKAIAA